MTLTTDLVIKIQWVDPKKLLILMNDIFSKKWQAATTMCKRSSIHSVI